MRCVRRHEHVHSEIISVAVCGHGRDGQIGCEPLWENAVFSSTEQLRLRTRILEVSSGAFECRRSCAEFVKEFLEAIK